MLSFFINTKSRMKNAGAQNPAYLRFSFVTILFITVSLHAQTNSPWETVAPPGSFVYTDLKTATKNASDCYRLDLSGHNFIEEKKQLPKVAKLTNVMAFRIGNNNLTELPPEFLLMPGIVYFGSFGNPLTTLPDSLGMLGELRFIEFSGTNFDTLPLALADVGRLQSLAINANKDTLCIPAAFANSSSLLTELRIYNT